MSLIKLKDKQNDTYFINPKLIEIINIDEGKQTMTVLFNSGQIRTLDFYDQTYFYYLLKELEQ